MSIPKDQFGSIFSDVMDMSMEQLKLLNDHVVREIKKKRKELVKELKQKLFEGCYVDIIAGDKLKGKSGIVEEIKQTRAIVRVDGQDWDCHISGLRPSDLNQKDLTKNN